MAEVQHEARPAAGCPGVAGGACHHLCTWAVWHLGNHTVTNHLNHGFVSIVGVAGDRTHQRPGVCDKIHSDHAPASQPAAARPLQLLALPNNKTQGPDDLSQDCPALFISRAIERRLYRSELAEPADVRASKRVK